MYFIIFIISFVLRFYLIRSLYWVRSLIPSWFRVLLFNKYPFPTRITSSPNINMDVTLLFLNRWWLWMRKTLVFLSLRFWCEAKFSSPLLLRFWCETKLLPPLLYFFIYILLLLRLIFVLHQYHFKDDIVFLIPIIFFLFVCVVQEVNILILWEALRGQRM